MNKLSPSSTPLYTLKSEIETVMPIVPIRWRIEPLINLPIEMVSSMKVKFGQGETPNHELDVILNFKKSTHLQSDLRSAEELERCQGEIREGHELASVCEELRHQASSIDKIHIRARLPEVIEKSPIVVRIEQFIRSNLLANIYNLKPRSGPGSVYEIVASVNRHGDESQFEFHSPIATYKLKDVRTPKILVPFLPFSLRDPISIRLMQKVKTE